MLKQANNISKTSKNTFVKPKVFVGMSGGVDSSVSAALLKQAGYDVTGVFIKVWQPDEILGFPCTWKEDRRDAMRVAALLDIPFYTLDLEKEYKKEVVDYMIEEYKKGNTPNPDVMCNKSIKFGGFLDWALKQGADFVGTGHYAQVKNSILQTSIDEEKDQTYFLWTLTKDQLSKTLFPIGHLPKAEVRKLAKKFTLPTFDKKDSQGLCFIGKIEMKEFLKHFVDEKPGKVLNTSGEEIGRHDGAFFYTKGQRHGFEIITKESDESPFYIVDKNLEKNTLTVAHKDKDFSENETTKVVELEKVNLTKKISADKSYHARIRYRQKLQECILDQTSEKILKITFTNPQEAVNSGQSIVMYDKNECIGGGVII